MKVNQISVYSNKNFSVKNNKVKKMPMAQEPVTFKGTKGKLFGGALGLLGAGVAVAICPVILAAAPLIGGIAATAGAKEGDRIEEESKKNKNKK